MNNTADDFYVLIPSKEKNNLFELKVFNNQEDKDTKLIVLHSSCSPNMRLLYEINLFNLPYNIRQNIIQESRNEKSFFRTSKMLFNKYCQIGHMINQYLSRKYNDVYFFCSILYNDFCLLVPEQSYDFFQIKKEIQMMLNLFYDDCNTVIIRDNYINPFLKRKSQIIKSDRQFVRHNPMFNQYISMIRNIDNIKSDSIDRIQELSLFSSLILKDLVEETKLYWIYDSGDLRYEEPDKEYILKAQNSIYFEFFNLFCEQAQDEHVYNDWIWSLVFLTQKLLYVLNNCIDSDDDRINFYGFIPIIKNMKKENNEVISLFTRHISRKFCHGFLIIPTGSIYNILEHLPAYVHEFFHYIPPSDRPNRNKAILELVAHSIFFNLRKTLSVETYKLFFCEFCKEFIDFSKVYYRDFFDSDSMEYIERLRVICLKFDFEKTYLTILHNLHGKIQYNEFVIFMEMQELCVSKWLYSRTDYVNIFTLFFREIRSDIAMCTFFNIDLEHYIRMMANEPLFAHLNRKDCGHSTILRFGYMCRYLLKLKTEEIDNKTWIFKTKKIISQQIQHICEVDTAKYKEIKKHYMNLMEYLDEYCDIAIETQDTLNDTKSSLIDEIIEEYSLVHNWEKSNDLFSDNEFVILVNELYQEYINEKGFENKLATICGVKILFRDLYAFEL